jgi:pheganomycin biosynthesis PGM1-like protein/ATP-grasp domain-containing protein
LLAGVRTLVVVSSLSFPAEELAKIAGARFYEERLLYTLLLLRDPNLRIVYATSTRIDQAIVEYYLRFLPDPDGARGRLRLVDTGDAGPASLTSKLLRRPDVLEEIRDAAAGGDAWLVPFNVTPDEERLAEALEVPLYGPRAYLVSLGSKSGGRETARRAGVAVPAGRERLFSLGEVTQAIEAIRTERPSAEAVVVKLNNLFSGMGNAVVDLSQPFAWVDEALTVFGAADESWSSFEGKIAAEGAIAEEWLAGPGTVSPSVQLHISPKRCVEIVSTHDQILGGPANNVYVGCRFPADIRYRREIQDEARKVGAVLADEGVLGWFGIDFLVVPRPADGSWHVFLSEINLRLGGTTHPFWMARLATQATYDQDTGHLVAGGVVKSYIASDNLKSARLRARPLAEVIEAVDAAGLGFDPATRTGTTLHLLGALPDHGKMGVTSIADDLAEAEEQYHAVEALLL